MKAQLRLQSFNNITNISILNSLEVSAQIIQVLGDKFICSIKNNESVFYFIENLLFHIPY